jgi:hypothetical protein
MKNATIILVLFMIVLTAVAMAPILQLQNETDLSNETEFVGEMLAMPKKDSVKSVKAFMDVYKVLMSPRCMNCHPAGDVPLQGDDSHLHTMLPRRGKEGKGLYAMKCMNCHQPTNTAGLNAPPGNPEWHLPPADMKMVFQGKTAHELAKQIVDPKLNGHKNLNQLIEHASDTLVLWGWNPGEGRTKPPLTYDEFKKAWITWIETGAYAPKK